MTEKAEVYDVVPVGQAFVPVNVDAAMATWRAYQELCQKLLDEKDYATIKGKKARKRSGWAKLRRFMSISAAIQTEERFVTGDDWGWRFTVRASDTAGRFEDGDGVCTYSELKEDYDKAKSRGREGILPSEHNCRSKALTRAKNRATSDLIGGGEVSAEELRDDDDEPAPKPATKTEQKAEHNGDAPKLFPIDSSGHKNWWSILVGEAAKLGYDNHHHIIKALTGMNYDPAALDYEHRDAILALLKQHHTPTPEQVRADMEAAK